MRVWERLQIWLGFEDKPREFELLESERGEPGFFGGWHDTKTVSEPASKRGIPHALRGCRRGIWEGFNCDVNEDVVLRNFRLGGRVPALCVYINGMADNDAVNDFILRDGMRAALPPSGRVNAEYAVRNIFTMAEAEVETDWDKACAAIMDGKSVVFLDGGHAVVMDTRGYEHRSVGAPENEKVIRGPQEGFTENLRTNITLLRRLLRTQDLVCELRDAGGGNHIKVAILYRDGVTNVTLVEEVKRRLARVKTDMLISIGVLAQLTQTRQLSVFPELLSTERPDRAAGFLMQGHVVVLLDGSPFANIMPTTLFALLSSAEDSYLREPQGSIIRVVRFLGASVSILLPGYFLSLTLYHQGLLSAEVINTIIASRKMVFTSLGLELVFLLLVFQLIREAGLRVPGSIGQAIGIVGGLILGQAAISANMASPVLLVVVALSGLGNFCIPDYTTQVAASYLRLMYVLAGWVGGLLGLTCATVFLTGYLASLKSYGVPYLAPFAPKTYSKYPLIRRGPIRMHNRATDFTNTKETEQT